MAARPDLYPFEADLHYFDSIVASAQRTIVAQIEAAMASGDLRGAARRQAQLAAIDQTLAQLAATANPLASKMVRDAWHQGAGRALKQVHDLPIDTVEKAGTFNGVSREAVQAMQDSLVQRLDSAQQTLGRRVQDIYAREQRRAALRAILGAEGSPSAASQHLQSQLLKNRDIARAVRDGGTGFVDSAGKRWSLDTYANMATRTVTREAVVQGAMARMVSHGIAIARVSTHAGSCEICVPFQGTLVALGEGAPAEWKGEAVSDTGEAPPYHPNCAHSLEPVSTTIQSLRDEMELEPVGA
jgi:hypothetical protein